MKCRDGMCSSNNVTFDTLLLRNVIFHHKLEKNYFSKRYSIHINHIIFNDILKVNFFILLFENSIENIMNINFLTFF